MTDRQRDLQTDKNSKPKLYVSAYHAVRKRNALHHTCIGVVLREAGELVSATERRSKHWSETHW